MEVGPAREGSLSWPEVGSLERYLQAVRSLNEAVRKAKPSANRSVSCLDFCEVVAFEGRPFAFEVSLAFHDAHGVPGEVFVYSKLASRYPCSRYPPWV